MSWLSGAAGSLGGILGGALGTLTGIPGGGLLGYTLGSGIGNAYASDYAYDKQLKDQIALMMYQNEYNTPVKQRERLEEAGYNPNLFYNTGANTSASIDSPKYKENLVNTADMLSAYNIQAQNDLLEAQRDATYWQAGVNQNNAVRQNALSRMAQYDADYAEAEHKLWKKTGKIPERYLRSDWSGELTGLLKGLFSHFAH